MVRKWGTITCDFSYIEEHYRKEEKEVNKDVSEVKLLVFRKGS